MLLPKEYTWYINIPGIYPVYTTPPNPYTGYMHIHRWHVEQNRILLSKHGHMTHLSNLKWGQNCHFCHSDSMT